MGSYWKDFDDMLVKYSFEAFDEHSGYSEGESFESLQDALDAFGAWQIEEGGAASAKRVCVNVYVPTERGKHDLFKSITAIEERI
ncbi:MAG: hypothetical protein IKE20_05450 [Eggerthellaceae bacterium]|nr:hypothetical protein [Eggerthellaceae bacterium]